MLAIKQELKTAHVPPERIKELIHSPEAPFGQMYRTFAIAYGALASSLFLAIFKAIEYFVRLKQATSEKETTALLFLETDKKRKINCAKLAHFFVH